LNIAVEAAGFVAGGKEDLDGVLSEKGLKSTIKTQTVTYERIDSESSTKKQEISSNDAQGKGSNGKADSSLVVDELHRTVDRTNSKNKVVFTNGCFDLIHINHLKCLQNARR
jgi:bifunctional ADP-heptose synthase (sugar kinase/adenylyltransferase)